MTPTFDTNAVGFSANNALVCALASREAYRVATITDVRTDTQVNITCDASGNVNIAFRGTSNFHDWITDVSAWRKRIGDCAVHAGFYTAIVSVIDRIYAELIRIEQAFGKLKSITVTGHSLGGALAVLGAEWIKKAGWEIHSVYTFGQPRVGNAAYRAKYNRLLGDRTFRLIHEEDIVPRVPFFIFGYRGTMNRIFLNSFGALEINPPIWKVLWSDVFGEFTAYRKSKLRAALEPVNDHNCDLYIKRLTP